VEEVLIRSSGEGLGRRVGIVWVEED